MQHACCSVYVTRVHHICCGCTCQETYCFLCHAYGLHLILQLLDFFIPSPQKSTDLAEVVLVILLAFPCHLHMQR